MDNERVVVIKNEDGGDIQMILKVKNYTDDIEDVLQEAREKYSDEDDNYDFIDDAIIVMLDEHEFEYEILAYDASEFVI